MLPVGPNDDGPDHLSLFDFAVRDRLLDAGHDGIPEPGVSLAGVPEHLDALELTAAGIVGHVQAGFLLNHSSSSPRAEDFSRMSSRIQFLVLLIGRVSRI